MSSSIHLEDFLCSAKSKVLSAAQEFLQRLKTVLRQYPPPQPKKPAVDLLVAVGDQQQYLHINGLLPPSGSDGALDALQVEKEPAMAQAHVRSKQ